MGKFHNGLVLIGLCSVSFYCGAQIAGQTEAAFSSNALLKPIEVSAAIVFPSTIQKLTRSAKQIHGDMLSVYESIPQVSDDSTLQELKEALADLTVKERELQSLLFRFENEYNEQAAYHKQVRKLDQNTYRFVLEGWNEIDGKAKQIKQTIDFQYMEKYRFSIELRIKKLEDAASTQSSEELGEAPEATPSTNKTEILDQNEGVPEHDEKRLKNNNETNE
ncbi:DUF4047 domain-containing protein [Fictibacillus sp. UD]|uniref:DUF4047 domain-containing protein n=1 Tax=Fictibacillus sp. UD TaxID=3038777 RepID=UPI003745B786